ncbi:hypothetical protein DICA2_E12948 [Diutina catenulata]
MVSNSPYAMENVSSILPSYKMYTSLFRSASEDDRSAPPGYSRSSSMTSHRSESTAATSVDDELSMDIIDNLATLQDLDLPGFKIDVHFTREVGKIGVRPEEITLGSVKPGDYIHGYINIDNESDTPYFFQQLFIMLEGVYSCKAHQETFLQMFDFGASYNLARINRLLEENSSPYQFRDLPTDPVDGRIICFHKNHKVYRCFHAKSRYKRYFSFKLPDKLLDSHCGEAIPEHLALPPTARIGSTKIHYAVTTRIIANQNPIILKQSAFPVTVASANTMASVDIENEEFAERLYQNMMASIKKTLKPEEPRAKGGLTTVSESYKTTKMLARKSFGRVRELGSLEVSSKKVVHPVYLNEKGSLSLPISLRFQSENYEPPNIKSTLVSVHEISYESSSALPFALGAFLFNRGIDGESLDCTINRVRSHAIDITVLQKTHGLKVEKSLSDAIKGICHMKWSEKFHRLQSFNSDSTLSKRVNGLPWQPQGHSLCKLFDIEVDYTHFAALAPSFQACRVGRFYLLKVTFLLATGQTVDVKVPVSIK